MFTWISLGSRIGRDIVFWDLTKSDCFLSLCSSFLFSHSLMLFFFNFILSSYTYLGARGIRVMVLPSFIISFLSYYHVLPNKIWLTCIGTTSHKISSTYFPIENGTTTYLVTFTSPLLFNHCNLYSWVYLTIHNFSLLTRVVLAILVQLLLSIIKLHTLFWA